MGSEGSAFRMGGYTGSQHILPPAHRGKIKGIIGVFQKRVLNYLDKLSDVQMSDNPDFALKIELCQEKFDVMESSLSVIYVYLLHKFPSYSRLSHCEVI